MGISDEVILSKRISSVELGIWAMNSSFVSENIQLESETKTIDSEANGFIAALKQITWEIRCPMRFTSYPVDKQVINRKS